MMLKKIDIVKKTLQDFNNIHLSDLDARRLLSRFDTKFIMDIGGLSGLLKVLMEQYDILEIAGKRDFNYDSLYFDTHDKEFYTEHHNGKLGRKKMRYRHYLDSGDVFFEIKNKGNNSKTIKERCKVSNISNELSAKAKNFITSHHSDIKPDKLEPALNVNYNRITLLHKDKPEKITFDTGITFDNGNSIFNTNGLVIIEHKSKKPNRSNFENMILAHDAQKIRISKYCLGTLLTNEDVKYNRFKHKLLTLNKVCNGHFLHS